MEEAGVMEHNGVTAYGLTSDRPPLLDLLIGIGGGLNLGHLDGDKSDKLPTFT